MEIKKAIITAAGKNQRTLPLQTLVDRDGTPKTALRVILEEVLRAGIEEIAVVVCPGDQEAFRAAAGPHASSLHFVEQHAPLGYAHAIYCAREFVGSSSSLLLVGDHLYLSRGPKSCAQQLVEVAAAEACSVSAVQATHESKLPFYGAVGGRLISGRQRLYQVEKVLEKPTPTEAEQTLVVPGLRAGYYLCQFGMHVLTPTVLDLLGALIGPSSITSGLHFSRALMQLAQKERYLALELQGRRFDIGLKYGLLTAQLALAMDGRDRDEVMAGLIELFALRENQS